jgi:hypothetical protein
MIEPVDAAKKIVDAVEKDGIYMGESKDYENFKTVCSYVYKMGSFTIKNLNDGRFMAKKRINYTDNLRREIKSPGTWVVACGNRYIISSYMNKYWPNWAYEINEIDGTMFEIKFLYLRDPIRDKIKDLNIKELESLKNWIEGLIQSKL